MIVGLDTTKMELWSGFLQIFFFGEEGSSICAEPRKLQKNNRTNTHRRSSIKNRSIFFQGWWDPTEVEGNVHTAVVSGLQPATKYWLRVIAAGDAGWSSPSDDLMTITNPEIPSGPPTRIEVRSLSSTQLLVTWAPPQKDQRNGIILGYNVGFLDIK